MSSCKNVSVVDERTATELVQLRPARGQECHLPWVLVETGCGTTHNTGRVVLPTPAGTSLGELAFVE